ncbi:hypothetical protein HpHA142_14340 [Helicobacter pylori]
MRGFSFIGGRIISIPLKKSVLYQNDQRPKSQGQAHFAKQTPKLLSLGELWLIHYFSIEKITLNPLKEILMYNTNQEFLSCFLFMINPFKNRFAPYRNYGA